MMNPKEHDPQMMGKLHIYVSLQEGEVYYLDAENKIE
jgi:hypothetical protein